MAWYVLVYSDSLSFVWSHAYLQVDIDPATAKTPYFSPKNADKWVVLKQWHTYWMIKRQEKRHALSQSGAAINGSPNHYVANG